MSFKMKKILICGLCSKYTMKPECPSCSGKTVEAKPPKFSLDDKYASYRREAKENERKEKGLL
jgi:rRNA maturation protein Nop10